MIDIGAAIRELRLARGMRQTDLADASEVGQSTISQLERGRFNPTTDTLARLAHGLGCTLEIGFTEIPETDLEEE